MMLLSRRSMLGIAAVVDIAVHGKVAPVAAKRLAQRNKLPPRHLETLLQALVREGILKGIRGPHGGYELARDRRHISAGQIVRAAMTANDEDGTAGEAISPLVEQVVGPAIACASTAFLAMLDELSVDQLCRDADKSGIFSHADQTEVDFTI
jgi:Rrf2 family protein